MKRAAQTMKQADRLTKGRERVHEEVAKVAAATATFGESDSGERGGERGGELGGERGRGASRTLAPPGVVGAPVEERAHAKQDFLAWARGRGVPAQDAEAEWRAQQETEEQSPWDAAQLVEEKRNELSRRKQRLSGEEKPDGSKVVPIDLYVTCQAKQNERNSLSERQEKRPRLFGPVDYYCDDKGSHY